MTVYSVSSFIGIFSSGVALQSSLFTTGIDGERIVGGKFTKEVDVAKLMQLSRTPRLP